MANPNPSPATRFKPGHDLGGKTSEQRKLDYKTAEIAAKARNRLVSIIGKVLDDPELEDAAALKMISTDVLRLLKDSEDRAHGTPKATTEVTGQNGGPVELVRYEVIDPPKRE
jgi:hypothetical protein